MRGIDDTIEPLNSQQFRHFPLIQAPGADNYILVLAQQRLAIFRGHAGSQLRAAAGQPFNQLPSLRCARKDADLTHPCIPSA